MPSVPSLEFSLRSPGQPERTLSVDSDTARVGSGAHCEIRLPSADAALEQLYVQARAAGVFAEARSHEPSTRLNGSAFVQGRLSTESVLCIGRLELRVTAVERHRLLTARSVRRRAGRGVVYVLGGIGIPLGILAAGPASPGGVADWNSRPARLWATEEPARCPTDEPGSIAAQADLLLRQGLVARERAPFSPADGVRAVALLEGAAACYAASPVEAEAAGAPSPADAGVRVRAELAPLKLELERQFHVHQVRLERALQSRRYDQAKSEIRILSSFAVRPGNPYFEWLSTLERQLDAQRRGVPS